MHIHLAAEDQSLVILGSWTVRRAMDRSRSRIKNTAAPSDSAASVSVLPTFWQNGMILKEGGLKGDVLLVYLTKHVLVTNGTELNRQHGQRDWRAKFEEVFVGGSVPYDRMVELVKAVNHGYAATSTSQDMVLQLAKALGADPTPLEKYYKHCASIQRDLSAQFEDDLDYLDLFGDKSRGKIFEEGRTMACISDCLRLHPTLMESTWNATHASRDSDQLFKSAADDIDRFNVMLDSDGRGLRM